MTTPPISTLRKLGLLAPLYFSQGLPFGFFTQALPALMRQQELSLAAIGSSTLLALPWGLKFLWAPWVDRYRGRLWGARRAWILPLQWLTVLFLLGLACVRPSDALTWLMIAVFATNLLSATQDIATDALAVDLLAPAERGLGNGVQVAGYRVGMIVGGGGLLLVYDHIGWELTFATLAAGMLLASIPIWRFDEARAIPRSEPADPEASSSDPGSALRRFFGTAQQRSWMIVLGLYKAGDYLGTSMLRPLMVDRGLTLSDIGIILGGFGFAAGLAGALAGGALVHRLGSRHALLAFGVLQAIAVGAYAVVVWGPDGKAWWVATVVFEHLATGMATAALFTVMMHRSRGTHAAADYTVQASWVVMVSGCAGALGGTTAQVLGYGPNFVLGGVVSLIAAGLSARVVGQAPEPAASWSANTR